MYRKFALIQLCRNKYLTSSRIPIKWNIHEQPRKLLIDYVSILFFYFSSSPPYRILAKRFSTSRRFRGFREIWGCETNYIFRFIEASKSFVIDMKNVTIHTLKKSQTLPTLVNKRSKKIVLKTMKIIVTSSLVLLPFLHCANTAKIPSFHRFLASNEIFLIKQSHHHREMEFSGVIVIQQPSRWRKKNI